MLVRINRKKIIQNIPIHNTHIRIYYVKMYSEDVFERYKNQKVLETLISIVHY